MPRTLSPLTIGGKGPGKVPNIMPRHITVIVEVSDGGLMVSPFQRAPSLLPLGDLCALSLKVPLHQYVARTPPSCATSALRASVGCFFSYKSSFLPVQSQPSDMHGKHVSDVSVDRLNRCQTNAQTRPRGSGESWKPHLSKAGHQGGAKTVASHVRQCARPIELRLLHVRAGWPYH